MLAYSENVALLAAWGWLVLIVLAGTLAVAWAIGALTHDEAETEFYAVDQFSDFRDELGKAVRR